MASRRGRLVGIIVSFVALLFAPAAHSASPVAAVRVLYPGNLTAHFGTLTLIAASGLETGNLDVELDGRPLQVRRLTFAEAWVLAGKLKATSDSVGDRTKTALWAVPLALTPGKHAVAVGGLRLDLYGTRSATEAAPVQYSMEYHHKILTSGKLDCGTCHGGVADVLGAVDTPRVCAPCHDDTAVQLIHSHVPQPLERCAICHDPHGSSRPRLLLNDKRILCSKCHEPGHIK